MAKVKGGKGKGGGQVMVAPRDRLSVAESRISLAQWIVQGAPGAITAVAGWFSNFPWILWVPASLVVFNEMRRVYEWYKGIGRKPSGMIQQIFSNASPMLLLLLIIGAGVAFANQKNVLPAIQPAVAAPRFLLNKQVATREELEAPRIVDRTVYLADIPRVNDIITKKEFEGCNIIGPGMISASWKRLPDDGIPGTQSVMGNCEFNAGSIDEIFLVIGPVTPLPRGVLKFKQSSFNNCYMEDVSLIGTKEQRDWILQTNPGVR